MEAFIGLVKDVGANKGALVSALGYTPAAKNIAEAAGLSLYTLIDAESEDWPAFVSMPVLIDDRTIDGVSYSLSFTELRSVDIRDIEKRSVFRKDGTRIGPLGDLVSRMWNEDRIPQEPGVHEGICLGDEATFFESDGRLVQVILKAKVRVAKTLYFGQLPIVEARGFRDDMTGGLHTRSITTDWLDFKKVKATWQVVPSEDALAVKPTMVQLLTTYYPLEGESQRDDEQGLRDESP